MLPYLFIPRVPESLKSLSSCFLLGGGLQRWKHQPHVSPNAGLPGNHYFHWWNMDILQTLEIFPSVKLYTQDAIIHFATKIAKQIYYYHHRRELIIIYELAMKAIGYSFAGTVPAYCRQYVFILKCLF